MPSWSCFNRRDSGFDCLRDRRYFCYLRGLAFIGDALAHGVLPGIAVSILAGFSALLEQLLALHS